MKEEGSQKRKPSAKSSFTRKVNFYSRVRDRIRGATDRVLTADAVWSTTFVVVVLLLLSTQRCGAPLERYQEGEIAPFDIFAPNDFEIADEILTNERRDAARAAVLDVYQYDTERSARLIGDLKEIFAAARRSSREKAQEQPGVPRTTLPEPPDDRLSPAMHRILQKHNYSQEVEAALESALRVVMRGYVMGNKHLIVREPEITLVRIPGGRTEPMSDFSRILDLDQAREKFARELAKGLTLPVSQEQELAKLANIFVDANMSFDPEGTRRRQEEAADEVSPVLVRVPRGTLLVKEGQEFTAENLRQMERASQSTLGRLSLPELLGMVAVVSMLAFFLRRYVTFHKRGYKKIPHLHALLVLVTLFMLLVARGTIWLAGLIVDRFQPPFNAVDLYAYLIPIGAGAVLVTLLANGRIAMIYSSFTAVLFGALNGWDLYLTIWALVVQFGGVYAISSYRKRTALIRAGLIIGCLAAASCLVMETLRNTSAGPSMTVYAVVLAFVGGAVGAGLIISFSLPILEFLFKVLTDIRLLELSNVDNPLLSQLAVKAPGSYNHSLVVGTLAEEAAKAIGANSLFCRVAAFYHDIGKMMKPEYYVENQRSENPHDRLAPSMSSLIISSHVKDGIRMAREAGLPEQILDIIPQHHGTRLMTYFYQKAREAAGENHNAIKEDDFRYPGPKPRTREAAIFMIADAVEAAARTVEEPNANRLREMIMKVSNAVVLDGQLEECDLTFVDLDRIQEAFLRTLVSIYHRRVDYPGFDFGKPKADSKGAGHGKSGREDGNDRGGIDKPEEEPDPGGDRVS